MNTIRKINTGINLIDSVKNMEELVSHLDPNDRYQVVAYTIPAIMLGEYHNGYKLGLETLEFYQIDSIRVFNSKCELYLYRFADSTTGKASSSLRGRLREDIRDSNSEQSYCHDASQILIGSRILDKTDTHTLISEDRGFQLLIPSNWLIQDVEKHRLRVITRNYLSEWDNGQLSYCDHRFVAVNNHEEALCKRAH